MPKRVVYLFLIVWMALSASAPLHAEYNPPDGSGWLYSLYAPPLLSAGAGASAVSDLSPAVDALNPAASGAKQRLTLDMSYLGLFGSDGGTKLGHVVNGGVTYPTAAGVLSGSARFITSPFDSLNVGTLAALNFSFAKDLFPRLLVGAGLAAFLGPDWGLGLDLGFVHLTGDVGFFKDLRWGGVIRGLGKAYEPEAGYSAFPAPYTPALGASFELLQLEILDWRWAADLSVPSFQSLVFSLGTEITFKDTFFISASSRYDQEEYADRKQLPYSFGLGVKLGAKVRKSQSEARISAAAGTVAENVWAVGGGVNIPIGLIDRDPPAIEMQAGEEYISPNLDGVQDELLKPIGISDERFVKGYRFTISDDTGAQVREIVNKDERPENATFKNIVDRLVYVKKGISIPEQLRWDGRSDTGSVVPDGDYSYQVEAWDDNGNTGRSAVGKVVVDNTPPFVEIGSPYLIFSPNEDGNKDTLPVVQEGSSEDLWQGTVTDVKGQEIRRFSWNNGAPADFSWDGKNQEELLTADGVYSYRISAQDRAGNTGGARIDNILINTQATPINITINESYFSPNADGAKDTLVFTLEVPVTAGIESWRLALADQAGSTVKEFRGTDAIPGSIDFDGRGEQAALLAEGRYRGELEVLYTNGNFPRAVSPDFTIDLTPPAVTLSADLDIFSPNGDGIKDEVVIYQETSEEPSWTGNIVSPAGDVVRTYSWRGRADERLSWEGRTAAGRLVPDGVYAYNLQATDRAGNRTESQQLTIELNTEQTEVFLSTDLSAFSPNADGVKERIAVIPTLKVETGVERYQIRILDTANQVVKSIGGRLRAPELYAWDGLDNQGRRAADGKYLAELILDYTKGDHHEVRTPAFTLDTVTPEIEIAADVTLFSPDGDGLLDTVRITQSSSTETLWEAEIMNGAGSIVRGFYWKGEAADLRWDGKDENGNKIADGSYTYIVRSTDAAGNSALDTLPGLTIDTRPTPIFLTVSEAAFSPNADGFRDALSFTPYVELNEGIESWKLELIHEDEGVQKIFSGSEAVPAVIDWDGLVYGSAGLEGSYQAQLTVTYRKGNTPKAVTSPFILDVSPPRVPLTVSPRPFSPDNDGVDDELYIALPVTDASGIADWELAISDPVGNSFIRFQGKGMPTERIVWDGLSEQGELVQAAEDYTAVFTIQDILGNAASSEHVIPVDVLVIREGDKLKIRIASITFPPNSADLQSVADLEKVEKNAKTLSRLAEILAKYSSYQIRIEGHANNLSFADPTAAEKEEIEELAPLSKARAEAVKQALVELGLAAERFTTAGLGGRSPIVPFADTENRWKNRRVEFILVKK
jgi:outer membrane protein OmpA-like peptidoglycan-associated protein/flagellar hook assembly protein FlgD